MKGSEGAAAEDESDKSRSEVNDDDDDEDGSADEDEDVASESAFSTGGRTLDHFRSSLTPTTVEVLICVQDWLRVMSKPIEVEELIPDLSNLEIDLKNNPQVDMKLFSQDLH
ncbi:hypothetical protein ACS0TY_005491 [Phlomoides rotata]